MFTSFDPYIIDASPSIISVKTPISLLAYDHILNTMLPILEGESGDCERVEQWMMMRIEKTREMITNT